MKNTWASLFKASRITSLTHGSLKAILNDQNISESSMFGVKYSTLFKLEHGAC